MCLLSNTNIFHYEFCEKKFPFLEIFPNKILSYKLHVMKPHPKIYAEAIRACRVAPAECVYIDDIFEFVEAADYLGMHGITFTGVFNLEKDLRELGVKI